MYCPSPLCKGRWAGKRSRNRITRILRGADMTKQDFLNYCTDTYGTAPDCPFEEDFVTTVLRHSDTKKWYAIVLRVPRRKFGQDSDELVDIVNMKLPVEMFGSFGKEDGVYPAYHMNKLHWISVLLPDAPDDAVKFLINVSFEATKQRNSNKSLKTVGEET